MHASCSASGNTRGNYRCSSYRSHCSVRTVHKKKTYLPSWNTTPRTEYRVRGSVSARGSFPRLVSSRLVSSRLVALSQLTKKSQSEKASIIFSKIVFFTAILPQKGHFLGMRDSARQPISVSCLAMRVRGGSLKFESVFAICPLFFVSG
jgi:hypothetical protein